MSRQLIDTLLKKGLIPSDTAIVSDHNQLVLLSKKAAKVFRVTTSREIQKRADPGNICYAHQKSWELSSALPVLKPLMKDVERFQEIILSTYPLLKEAKWAKRDAEWIMSALSKFHSFDVSKVELRKMNIQEYARERLVSIDKQRKREFEKKISWAENLLKEYSESYPFEQLTSYAPTVVHGDLHQKNIVETKKGEKVIIDLDSVAVGPAAYDLASWRVRELLGDQAPVALAAEKFFDQYKELVKQYKILMGWKIVSSVTNVLKNGSNEAINAQIELLASIGKSENLPGKWGE